MAGFALRLLLATYGTAHASRHSLVANLNTTAARHSSVAKHNATASGAAESNARDPGVADGGIWNLDNNEYVLEWSESAEAWGFYETVKEDGRFHFITPVMCRNSGIWYKLEIKHSAVFKNCILVTCNLEGNVEKIEPQGECYEYTSKVFRTHGPYVTRGTDWALFHVPHFKQLPALDTSKPVDNGWSFDSMTVEAMLKKHEPQHYYDFADEGLSNKYGWGFSKKCERYEVLWKQVDGLMFTTPASLETCKTRRTEVRKSCASKYERFVGTTAWGVKDLIPKKVLFKFESCHTWCAKENDCYKKDAPEGVKRDKKAFMEAMNSWKFACEQELDILVADKMKLCNGIGSICDKPWAKILPCAQTYSTPFFYNN